MFGNQLLGHIIWFLDMRPSGFPSQGATCHALIFDVPLEDPQYLPIMENLDRNTMGFLEIPWVLRLISSGFFWSLLRLLFKPHSIVPGMLSKSTASTGSWGRFEAANISDTHVLFRGKTCKKKTLFCSGTCWCNSKILVLEIRSWRPPWMVNSLTAWMVFDVFDPLVTFLRGQGAVAHDPWSWSCTRCNKRQLGVAKKWVETAVGNTS